jgi:phospholipase/carboxylesterase
MLYRLYKKTGDARILIEVRSRSSLSYCTAKAMRLQYPDGNFVIIGEIGGIARPSANGDWLITEGGKSLPILPRGSLKKPLEWVSGYIAVGKDTYIAVIRSLFHFFSCPFGTIRLNLRI